MGGWVRRGLRDLVPALVCLITTSSVSAATPPPSPGGWELGFRTGVAVPLGNADQNTVLGDWVGLQIPLWFDAGYRVWGGLVFVGAWANWSLGSLKNSGVCDHFGLNCWTRDLSVGAEVLVHPARYARLDPWFGLGFGYEWLTAGASYSSQWQTSTLRGWEFGNIQLGLDIALTGLVRGGPFMVASLGEYSNVSYSSSVGSGTSFVLGTTKALHVWLTFGVRITVLP